MYRAKVARIVLLAAVAAAMAAPARAQIYTWRDEQGNLVLSDSKPAPRTDLRTFAVPEAPAVRTTRPVVIEDRDRAAQFDGLIEQHAQSNGVRAELVRAVMQVESAFNQYARSPKGALGLMQLMPATIRQFGVRNPFNPAENIRAGVAYLRQLLDRYGNDEQLALAAYNAGPGAVDKHGTTVPPYKETRNYVSKIGKIAGKPEPVAAGTKLYRTVDIVDGREIVKYTDKKPD
jgi:soluble lytic murein transglycosylase-like protein